MIIFVHVDVRSFGVMSSVENISLAISNFINADVDCMEIPVSSTNMPGLYMSAPYSLSRNGAKVDVMLTKSTLTVKRDAKSIGTC